ncbi:phospholipase D family protein [Metallibacterium scheffleri]|uniref:NgoFVII family restriction endonuclease n=1 Tax=Metallibacterium scheffleri TaxID=993689 RepID=A0A4S3KEY8_9GAMM|nr:phospholipase D family protein [Metallibacterium scheffleri]THD07133.1 NgoFVII family restriction endonuclease [Metallibacterium scheffleri]
MNVELLVNSVGHEHADVVIDLLKRADRMHCMVAFAKKSAPYMLDTLKDRLKKGLIARMAIGLDFHLTEPKLLRELFELGLHYKDFELFLNDTVETFHPKIYAFEGKKWKVVLIGSANLTNGGFSLNYEASALINDVNGSVTNSIKDYFDELVNEKVLIKAKAGRIDEYEREYGVNDFLRNTQKPRADKLLRDMKKSRYGLLGEMLKVMKDDESDEGFLANQIRRNKDLFDVAQELRGLASGEITEKNFLQRYEALIRHFHSSGLDRGKTKVANHAKLFLVAIAEVMAKRSSSPIEAFNVLHKHFQEIPGAGINLLTEILHAIDNSAFAVMNQNAVSGMQRAGIYDYPSHPSKKNVNGDAYARYCQQAHGIRNELGLENFTELDALFNYAYWR